MPRLQYLFAAMLISLSQSLLAQPLQSPKPVLKVTKTETCGCCAIWVERAEMAGYQVEVQNVSNSALDKLKDRLGIPFQARSCHTAEAAGYYIEGHVPLADVDRLLTEKPEAAGIAVPGMPLGSPGMDFGPEKQAYNTYILTQDNRAAIYAKHNQ